MSWRSSRVVPTVGSAACIAHIQQQWRRGAAFLRASWHRWCLCNDRYPVHGGCRQYSSRHDSGAVSERGFYDLVHTLAV